MSLASVVPTRCLNPLPGIDCFGKENGCISLSLSLFFPLFLVFGLFMGNGVLDGAPWIFFSSWF